jgi:PAS domain S-box-containing protein
VNTTDHGPNRARPFAELRLEPRAQSVGAARRFLREVLRESDRARWSDAAELALSEVVTNGVLHAHTELTVRIRVLDDLLEIEVADGNPALPAQRRAPDAEATTGRGLELVAALTRECGVRPEPAGKVVWFTVGDDEPAQELTADELLEAWDLDEAWGTAAAPETTAEVVLLDLPTTLWMAAREHHQAVLRELVLYLAEHEDAGQTPPDLVLADEARNVVWTTLLAEVDRAREDGRARRPLPDGHPSPLPDVPESVDLRLSVRPDIGHAFAALQDALDVGEQLSVEDLLLVRPGLPEIIAVRDWLCDQVVAQLAGVAPSPWPGTDQSRFTDLVHDRADAVAPVWDSALVTDSDRGVVAADDANRIIAISASLARTLGWAPEEIVGRRVVALVPPQLREAHVAGFSRHLSTGQAHVLGVDLELPVLHRDGRQIPCRFLVERAPVGVGRPVYLAWIEPLGP